MVSGLAPSLQGLGFFFGLGSYLERPVSSVAYIAHSDDKNHQPRT